MPDSIFLPISLSGNVCHFLCLETKKVTQENSRQKQMLRCFCLAYAQVAELLTRSFTVLSCFLLLVRLLFLSTLFLIDTVEVCRC